MQVKINHNNENLYCLYSKEKIEVGERYVEVLEDYLGEDIIKTYKYDYLDMIVDNYIDENDEEPYIVE